MNSLGKQVKNYAEYQMKLKDVFGESDDMPKAEDIQSFIVCNNLWADWEIDSSDVRQDIRKLILMPKRKSGFREKKKITSYKKYLDKLRDTFGIPETMPNSSRISEFIDEYKLFDDWGITEEDVSKDLQSFIDDKYDKVCRKAPSVYRVVASDISRPRSSAGNIVPPAYSSCTDILRRPENVHPAPKSCGVESSAPKRIIEKTNPQKPKTLKPKTIFIDGDNHFDEGQKGVERVSKKIRIKAFFTQEGAKRKFDEKYGKRPNVSSELVAPGNQAVDTQIKTEIEQLMKSGNQDIAIVSQDKGFDKFKRNKMKKKKGGNSICVVKSVNEAMKQRKVSGAEHKKQS